MSRRYRRDVSVKPMPGDAGEVRVGIWLGCCHVQAGHHSECSRIE